MSDRRVLGFAWLALTLVLWLVLRDLASWLFATAAIANPELAGGTFKASAAVAAGISVGTSVVLWKRKEVYDFCFEVVNETRKVIWPSRQETRDHSVVVVITSFIFAFFLWAFDQVWKKLFAIILSLDA